jgi:hypothetical protein
MKDPKNLEYQQETMICIVTYLKLRTATELQHRALTDGSGHTESRYLTTVLAFAKLFTVYFIRSLTMKSRTLVWKVD